MNDETFDLLALKVVDGTATAEEAACVAEECAANPERKEEVELLRQARRLASEVLPVAQAVTSSGPALPEYRRGMLRQAVKDHFRNTARPRRPWWTGLWVPGFTGAMVCALLAAVFLMPSGGRIEIGFLHQPQTRGVTSDVASKGGGVMLREFLTEEELDQWKSRPMPDHQIARIYLDEDAELIRVFSRDKDGRLQEKTYSLPSSNELRIKMLQEIVATLR